MIPRVQLLKALFLLLLLVGCSKKPAAPTDSQREQKFQEMMSGVALVGGFFGGLSGIWGPPLIMYLLAVGLPKVEMVRVQSLSFLLGAMVLFVAHLHSGVLNAVTLPVSAWLVLPTMAAMFLGYRVHDRLDQARFLKVTLVVLVLTGLNLLRRALF